MTPDIHALSAALSAALVSAQTKIKRAVKSKTNDHFRASYADLADVLDACQQALNEAGLACVQRPTTRIDAAGRIWVDVETMILHESGAYTSSTLGMPVAKPDPQGIGSAITYGRRFGLSSMVGVSADDDDGAQASADVEYITDDQAGEIKALIEETGTDVQAFLAKCATAAGTPTIASVEQMTLPAYTYGRKGLIAKVKLLGKDSAAA